MIDVFRWVVSGLPTPQNKIVLLSFVTATSGFVTLSIPDHDDAIVALLGADSATVQTNLDTAWGAGTTTVTGNSGDGYTIEFVGSLGNQPVAVEITYIDADGTPTLTETQAGIAYARTTWTWNETEVTVDFGGTDTIQSKAEELFGAGNVTTAISGVNTYTFTMIGDLLGEYVETPTATADNYEGTSVFFRVSVAEGGVKCSTFPLPHRRTVTVTPYVDEPLARFPVLLRMGTAAAFFTTDGKRLPTDDRGNGNYVVRLDITGENSFYAHT